MLNEKLLDYGAGGILIAVLIYAVRYLVAKSDASSVEISKMLSDSVKKHDDYVTVTQVTLTNHVAEYQKLAVTAAIERAEISEKLDTVLARLSRDTSTGPTGKTN